MQESILIIGRPDSGKTRFLTQFCARAEKGKSAVKFFDRANDISHISDDRKRSAQGLNSVRTASDVYIDVDLHIEVDGRKRTINYPDVAGEQINQIVKNRLINKKWKQQMMPL